MTKYYTIATVRSENYGQGDSVNQDTITRVNSWNVGDFPPLFETEEKAELWLNGRKFYCKTKIVELKTQDEDFEHD